MKEIEKVYKDGKNMVASFPVWMAIMLFNKRCAIISVLIHRPCKIEKC